MKELVTGKKRQGCWLTIRKPQVKKALWASLLQADMVYFYLKVRVVDCWEVCRERELVKGEEEAYFIITWEGPCSSSGNCVILQAPV